MRRVKKVRLGLHFFTAPRTAVRRLRGSEPLAALQQHSSKMSDTENAIADSIASHYAGVMDDLIADCHRLEDQVAELTRQRDQAISIAESRGRR